ncbi:MULTISPECIES: SPOR domain-containing protein [unclassified Shimia]|uniref:SPOR domain-containing protein n=1 Tax=unclassified Shimia TaxID=2630038 RepID=UPI0031042893
MAEIPMGVQGAAKGDSPNAALLVNRAGIIVSAALMVGACVWGYRILSRDVSGVPVVRALEGPMRIQPENPGGRQAGHQGLMVNEVAADGGAAGPADQVIVAPPAISISERDKIDTAVAQASANEVKSEGTISAEVDAVAQAKIAPIVAPEPLDISAPLSVEELAAQLAAGATPLETVSVEATVPIKASLSASDTLAEPEVASESNVIEGGLKRSLRPVLRPSSLAASSAQTQIASIDAAVGSVLKTADPADIVPGTRLVQLGAYESTEIAETEWARLQSRFEPYLGDKTRVIQKASSGGRVFYRLRAMGFDTVSDARRLCSALKAENADCIPVTTR